MSNLLHHEGMRPTTEADEADLILVHTCSIREKAEQKLYSELGALLGRKRRDPELIVGVGGCVAQQEGGELLRRFPGLDFVFGPQNLVHLPTLISNARARARDLRVGLRRRPHGALRAARAAPRIHLADPRASLRHGDGRLRPVLYVLRRAVDPRPRGQPPESGDPRRGGRARRARCRRGHPARPNGQRLRSAPTRARRGGAPLRRAHPARCVGRSASSAFVSPVPTRASSPRTCSARMQRCPSSVPTFTCRSRVARHEC